jgi:hypothetical protein
MFLIIALLAFETELLAWEKSGTAQGLVPG